MKKLSFIILMFFISFNLFSQKELAFLNGKEETREINPGRGPQYWSQLEFYDNFYFIQFAVYPSNFDKLKIFAPNFVGPVWLIHHEKTEVNKHKGENGALYLVKPYSDSLQLKSDLKVYQENRKMDCWFNRDLNNIRFQLVGIKY